MLANSGSRYTAEPPCPVRILNLDVNGFVFDKIENFIHMKVRLDFVIQSVFSNKRNVFVL